MRADIKKTVNIIADFLPGLMSGVQLVFFAKHNITSSQFVTLMAMFHQGRCTMGQLSSGLRVRMPTVTGLINRLMKLDMVERVAGQQDRRKVFVELSPKGRNLIKEFKKVVKQRWGGLLITLKPEEVRAYGKMLEKLSKHITEQAPRG